MSSAKAMAISAPRPEFPYEARRQKITGDGVAAVMSVDATTGCVMDVVMAQSAGNAALDHATITGLRRWRFQSGTVFRVRCPITYTLAGIAY